ncbi:MAG: laccase domain-containing protein [Gemmatimonadales bacterium]|nr:MAG: laccase domain-containing protein [Gemmatimonadales bacterium]
MPESSSVDGVRSAPSSLPIPEPPPMPAPVGVEPWADRFPWLIAGTTTRGGAPAAPFDLGLFGNAPVAAVLGRWEALRRWTGMRAVVHSRQLHGTGLRLHRHANPGLHLTPPGDAHLTREPGLLLTVALADCVPIFVVAPERRVIALVHAGWRGSAAGILEHTIHSFQTRFGVDPEALHLHLGPAIGADAYEVGPEVFRGLGLPDPGGPALLDLRGVLVERAERAGVDRRQITRTERGTLRDPRFFSHRGGDTGRQVAFLGIRDPGPDDDAPSPPDSNADSEP